MADASLSSKHLWHIGEQRFQHGSETGKNMSKLARDSSAKLDNHRKEKA